MISVLIFEGVKILACLWAFSYTIPGWLYSTDWWGAYMIASFVIGLFALTSVYFIYIEIQEPGFEKKQMDRRVKEAVGYMAECGVCGHAISNRARACPNCGQPNS
jgi:hypothetical protein